MTIPSTQPFLRFPGDGLYAWCRLFGPPLQGRCLAGWKPITPSRFGQDAADVRIAGLGNSPSLAMIAAGMLAGHQTDEGHQLPRRVKARDISQLRHGRHGGEGVHPAQGHHTARLRLQRPALQRLLQFLVQSP